MPFRLPHLSPSVVLFPGTPLPLHIFEPRYRTMLADCLEGDRRFGIYAATGSRAAPARAAVGCVAEIRVNQQLPDGRSNIVVVGGSRFTVSQLARRVVCPTWWRWSQTIDDEPMRTPAADETPTRPARALRTYFSRLRELNDTYRRRSIFPTTRRDSPFSSPAALECDPERSSGLLLEPLDRASGSRRCSCCFPCSMSAVELALTGAPARPHQRQGRNEPPPLLARTVNAPVIDGAWAGSSAPAGCGTGGPSWRPIAMDGLPTHESVPGLVVLPGHPRRSARGRPPAPSHGIPFVARGAGTGLSGGALADPDAVLITLTRLNRILSRGSRCERRAVVEPGVVNARLSEAVRPFGLQYAPDPSSQAPAPSAATWRRTRAGLTASSTGSPPITSSRWRSCCPTARWPGWAHPTASRGAPTWWGCSSAARECSASPWRSRVRLVPLPAERAHHAGRLLHRAGRKRGGVRDHRVGHRSRRARNDGPCLRRGGRSFDLRSGLSDRRGGGAAGRAGRRRPAR